MGFYSKYVSNNYKHVVYEVFGIKFKFLNPHYPLYRHIEGMNKMLDYLADIETLPKAKGKLRDKQLQVLEILKLVDGICKKHSISYWLDFGSLLGAVRHKGFIPWDDDIDTCVLREDFEKLLKILHEELKDSKYYVRERWEFGNNFQIRVILKGTNFGLDFFPVDKYVEARKNDETDIQIAKKIDKARSIFDRKWNKETYSIEQVRMAKKDIIKFSQEVGLISDESKIEKPVLFYGIDYYHKWNYKSFDYDTIFPLAEVEFEGLKFPVPNKYKEHLAGIYGDYNKLPKNFDNIDWFWG